MMGFLRFLLGWKGYFRRGGWGGVRTKEEGNRNEEEGRQRDWRGKGRRQMGKEGV